MQSSGSGAAGVGHCWSWSPCPPAEWGYGGPGTHNNLQGWLQLMLIISKNLEVVKERNLMGKRLHLLVIFKSNIFFSTLQFISLCQPLKSHLALHLDLGGSYLSICIWLKISKLAVKI